MIGRAFSRFRDLFRFGRAAIVPAARMLFPHRRRNFSLGFVYHGVEFTVSFSFLDKQAFRVGEIFINQKKSNSSELEALARDSMILASFALQHGAPLEFSSAR